MTSANSSLSLREAAFSTGFLARAEIASRPREGGRYRGHLETLMQPPTLDQIRDAFGGGQYLIRVSGPKPGAKGIKFITTRVFRSPAIRSRSSST